MSSSHPPVVLFGYESSTFTLKARLVLKLKQIPYTFVTVPSMMPRPLLRDNFNLTYRKIPVLAIGREIYCDTSIIVEALEHFFPESDGFPSVYPPAADGRTYRPMIRGFASYWTDRPLFRIACGLIPGDVWRTSFGTDRAGLIGHKLDPAKLEKKIPENMGRLDQQLSMLEPLFHNADDGPWIFSTSTPSLADLSLFYELSWGTDIAAGRRMANLTAGGAADTDTAGARAVFNPQRYPRLLVWYRHLEQYLAQLPACEEDKDPEWRLVLERMEHSPTVDPRASLLPTPRPHHAELDAQCGLTVGALVSIAPDDTGRDDPTLGTIVALSPEEIVIEPRPLAKRAAVDVRVHFPRLGFVARPVDRAKL